MSLLSAGQSRSVADNIPDAAFTPESIATSSSGLIFPDTALPINARCSGGLQPKTPNPLPSISVQEISVVNVQRPSSPSDQDSQTIQNNPEALLDIFLQNLARLTPFISIPPDTDAQTLSTQRPFLYQAIVAVSSYHDSVHHTELGQQLLKDITESLVIQGQKSLDLLQGLLIYIAWLVAFFHVIPFAI